METKQTVDPDLQKLYDTLNDLYDPKKRGDALKLLASENFKLDPIVLWNAFGIVTIFLQEITSIYPCLNPCTITPEQCDRLINVLSIIQYMATSPQTYKNIIQCGILVFIYPLIKTEGNSRHITILRVTALNVIGAVSKVDKPDIIPYLINTDILSICLNSTKEGSLIEKTITSFILQRIVQDVQGLDYICSKLSTCQALCSALSDSIIASVNSKTKARLIKHVVRFFQYLSKNSVTHDIIAKYYPPILNQENFQKEMDDNTKELHSKILAFIQ